MPLAARGAAGLSNMAKMSSWLKLPLLCTLPLVVRIAIGACPSPPGSTTPPLLVGAISGTAGTAPGCATGTGLGTAAATPPAGGSFSEMAKGSARGAILVLVVVVLLLLEADRSMDARRSKGSCGAC